jgi:uncharacterized membrane protein
MASPHTPHRKNSAGRYILIGVLTAAPLAITWIILDFLFGQLARIGRPWVTGVARTLAPEHPILAAWLQDETFLSVVAALLVLGFLWVLGWGASRVIGQRLILIFEWMIGRIPVVERIYQATKRFLTVAANSADGGERRVVLVDFPSPEMKTIGLVTRILKDEVTGEELAAVYVPTTPNPTSGFVQIIATSKLIWLDWSKNDAMAFVVSGGAMAPDNMPVERPLVKAAEAQHAAEAARAAIAEGLPAREDKPAKAAGPKRRPAAAEPSRVVADIPSGCSTSWSRWSAKRRSTRSATRSASTSKPQLE